MAWIAPALLGVALFAVYEAAAHSIYRPTGFEPWRIWLFGRPDVKKPDGYLDLTSGPDAPIETTLFEYTYRDQSITNGHSRTYRIPKAYYVKTINFAGYVSMFMLNLDLSTLQPFRSSAGKMRPTAETIQKDATREVVISITTLLAPFLPTSKQLAAARNAGMTDPNTMRGGSASFGRPVFTGESYCGFDLFESEPRGNLLARANQLPPFNRARVFARRDGDGGYRRIIECNDSSRFGWCWTNEPIGFSTGASVYFGGANLCRVEEVVNLATSFLASHLINETPPIPGWGAPPGTYNN